MILNSLPFLPECTTETPLPYISVINTAQQSATNIPSSKLDLNVTKPSASANG